MPKQEKTTKQPKTIELKLLVPYAIIIATTLVLASFITAWFTYRTYESTVDNRVKAEVQQVLSKTNE